MDMPQLRVVEGGVMDKQKALEAALAQIDKAFDVFAIPMFYESYEELFFVMDAGTLRLTHPPSLAT